MAKSISTKKAEAEAAEMKQENRPYISLDEIPWNDLAELYGIRKEDFLGDSKMNKGRRDALTSGNWTPTFECHKSTRGIHVENTYSMRAIRIKDDKGADDIRISLESPLHESLDCEFRLGETELPEEVRKALATTGNAGRIVQIEERVFQDGKPVPVINRADQVDSRTGEVIAAAGSQRINPENGRGMFQTEKNSYFLSLNPYTRRIQKRMATRELKDGINFPDFYNYFQQPSQQQLDALRAGDAVNVLCQSKESGHVFARCLQFNAATGLVEHNADNPKLRDMLPMVEKMNEMLNPKESQEQAQAVRQSM